MGVEIWNPKSQGGIPSRMEKLSGGAQLGFGTLQVLLTWLGQSWDSRIGMQDKNLDFLDSPSMVGCTDVQDSFYMLPPILRKYIE